MTKDHWKAAAIVLAGLLIVTNAAGFYTRRVMTVEQAERLAATACPTATPVIVRTERLSPMEAQRLAQIKAIAKARAEQQARPATNERCIDGRLFRKYGNAWTDAGNC